MFRFAFSSFFIGLLAVSFFWFTYLFLDDQSLSIEGLRKIHENNPALYVLDGLPLMLVFLSVYLHFRSIRQIKNLKEEIENIKENIEEKAALAKRIGESGLQAQTDEFSDEDVLGKALTEMQRALSEARRKDSEAQWVAESLAELGEILRRHQTTGELATPVISYLRERTGVILVLFYERGSEQAGSLNLLCSSGIQGDLTLASEINIACIPEKPLRSGKSPNELVLEKPFPEGKVEEMSQDSSSSFLYIPLISEGDLFGLLFVDCGSFLSKSGIKFLIQSGEILGRTLFNNHVNERTFRLLEESRRMRAELEQQHQELLKHQHELAATGELLMNSHAELEKKIQEIENNKKRLELLMENASEITAVFNEDQKLVFISPSVKRILGYEPQDLTGTRWLRGSEEDIEGIADQLFARVKELPGIALNATFGLKTSTGRIIAMEHTAINLIHDSAVKGIVMNSRDLSMQQKAEIEMMRRNQMQSLSENSNDLIIRLNKLGVFYYVNPRIESYTGYSPAHYLNKSIDLTVLPPSFSELYEKLLYEAIGTGNKVFSEMMLQDGQRRIYLSITAIPEFDESKEADTVLFVAHDITELKLAEAEIRRKNNGITDSIKYSYSIQRSLMPTEKVFQHYFSDSFLLYQPRDIISGDFPWVYRQGQYLYLAIADCTGHGVPGALLSLVGYFQLNHVSERHEGADCGEILNLLNKRVREILRQDSEDGMTKDGMDIALLRWDEERRILQFSGAHRPLLYLDEAGNLNEIRGDRSPIAGFQRKDLQSFHNHQISCTGSEKFFLFTDGLPDQFGGSEGKEKLMMDRIRNTITENRDLRAAEIGKKLHYLYQQWMGEHRQIDDTLLLCFGLNEKQNSLN